MNNKRWLSLLLALVMIWPAVGPVVQADDLTLDRAEYADRLRAMWLGQTIANWTGLTTEGVKEDAPFYTDDDWGLDQDVDWKTDDVIHFVFQDPWLADDDTDIEYVYLHLLAQYNTHMLTPEQIAAGWREHINDYIWVSNATARSLMEQGTLPPVTGLSTVNENSLQIDAQLTTEVFGALAPGMPGQALLMADLPIRTTAAGYAAHAAQFNVLLYALAAQVDPALEPRDQVIWLVEEARRYIPDTSKTADIVDFVLADYLENPDPTDWESTRDKVYERYHQNARDNDFLYRGWTESSVNFGAGLIALLYGEGDFQRTVQIGTLSGWDSDNGTASMGGLLGLLLGYDALVAQFPDEVISDRYKISRTRDNLPDYLPDDGEAEDTFTLMAERMLPVIDQAVVGVGGAVSVDGWQIPAVEGDPLALNPLSQLMERSTNYRVLADGGTITTAVGEGGSSRRTQAIADGSESDYSGQEVLRSARAYETDPEDGLLILTVNYDRLVPAQVIRFIEGNPGGFATLSVELLIDDEWLPAPPDTMLLGEPDPAIPFQLFDFVLPEEASIQGMRLTGDVEVGPFGDVGIVELDALASLSPTLETE